MHVNKYADHHVHLHSLISVFVIHFNLVSAAEQAGSRITCLALRSIYESKKEGKDQESIQSST